MPLRLHQTSARENRKMRRHGVLRHVELAGDFAGGDAIGFVPDQETEGIEPRALGQRAQRGDSRIGIHISKISDILADTIGKLCLLPITEVMGLNGDKWGDTRRAATAPIADVRRQESDAG